MEEDHKKDNSLGIIIGLVGFILGAFLIKKIIQSKKAESPSHKISKKLPLKEQNDEIFLDVNPRQKRIFNMLKKKGTISSKDLVSLVPSVSSRTLRRDMDVLVKLGVASQKGSTKSTYYKYING